MDALKIEERFHSHMKLAHHCVNRYRNRISRNEADDLSQIGQIALWEASRRFSPDLGNKFSTYAYGYIHGYIRNYLRDNSFKRKRSENTMNSIGVSTVHSTKLPLDSLYKSLKSTIKTFDGIEMFIAIDSLPEKQCRVIKQKLVGYTQQEIAEAEGITQSAVSRILDSAISKVHAATSGKMDNLD